MDAADLAFAGIAQQAQLIASGELSAQDLLEVYLERIQRLNPKLNAFRVVFHERARMEAAQADARRRSESPPTRRPLLGVPFAVKDDIDVAGEVTGLGSSAYGEPAREDAEVVRRLRAAGAVIVGKTNVPELCAFPWTESAARGATRNPWNLEHTPGGSSGGSAAAVAAGLVGAALGSDGGGSIRFPAAYCGLFGLKTQRGRVPMAPHLDAVHGLSVNGVLTRSVRDAALFHDAIADGPPDPDAPVPPRCSFLDAASLETGEAKPLRIAVATNLPPSPLTRLHPENRAAVEETAQLLRSLGHDVREVEVDHGPLAPALEFTVRYMRGLHDEADAMAHPERLERRMRNVRFVGGLLPESLVGMMRAREGAYAARLNAAWAEYDVLLTPVTPAPAPRVGACDGRGWLWTTVVASATVPYATPWNTTGQPACSVPAGFAVDGLPRAVQLVGHADGEAALLTLAARIEAERPWAQRRPALAELRSGA